MPSPPLGVGNMNSRRGLRRPGVYCRHHVRSHQPGGPGGPHEDPLLLQAHGRSEASPGRGAAARGAAGAASGASGPPFPDRGPSPRHGSALRLGARADRVEVAVGPRGHRAGVPHPRLHHPAPRAGPQDHLREEPPAPRAPAPPPRRHARPPPRRQVNTLVAARGRPRLGRLPGLLHAMPSNISATQFSIWHLDHHNELGHAEDDPKRAHLSPKKNTRWTKLLYMTPALFVTYIKGAAKEVATYPADKQKVIRRERLLHLAFHLTLPRHPPPPGG